MPRSRPRHDHDAGGSAGLLAAKAALRQEVWGALRAAKATRFPGPEGRIPNFVGAEAAAELLRSAEPWQAAGTLKANPDSPQWPVRQRALEDGKLVFMAVPRLAEEEPFFLLDPERLPSVDQKPVQCVDHERHDEGGGDDFGGDSHPGRSRGEIPAEPAQAFDLTFEREGGVLEVPVASKGAAVIGPRRATADLPALDCLTAHGLSVVGRA